MLWARLVSRALDKVCPELVAGIYTPEEMRDVIDIDSPVRKPLTAAEFIQARDVAEPAAKDAAETEAELEIIQEAVAAVQAAPEPVAPEPPAVSEPPAASRGPVAAPKSDPLFRTADEAPGTVSESVRVEIERLFEEANVSAEGRSAALKKRGVNAVRSLSDEDADVLLRNLRARVQQLKSAGN